MRADLNENVRESEEKEKQVGNELCHFTHVNRLVLYTHVQASYYALTHCNSH